MSKNKKDANPTGSVGTLEATKGRVSKRIQRYSSAKSKPEQRDSQASTWA